ncbi:MAG: Ig-like domain-containing protein [Candidatus Neomarinimicrobiota bacterium]
MKKIFVVLSTIFLAACGGGGGGAEAPAPVVPPAPAPLTITLNDSSHSTDEDNAVTANFDVSTNRSATLSYTASDEPDYGSVSFSGNSFTYTPNDNFFGSDEFEVTASAESASDSAKISLTINSVNDVPVLEVSLVESDDSEYPLIQETGTITINLNYSDVETANDSLTLSVASDVGTVILSDVADGKAKLDFSNLAGPKNLSFLVSDGESSANANLKLWYAQTVETEDNIDNIYTLWGNTEDLSRGFRYALILDAMPSAEVMTAGREALKYFFNEFVHNGNSTLRKTTIDMFNAVVIESPIGESTLGVVTGNDEVYEGCPSPGGDPDIYCIGDLKPIIYEYVGKNFTEGYFDNYSVITGISGRGVNNGDVNIQPLLYASDINDAGTQYQTGPNYLLGVLKHEFGHGYLFAGDHYTSDFTAEDEDGNPKYDLTYKYKWTDNSIDISYKTDPLEVQWVHQFKSTTNIPGRDDTSDTSNEAIGYWDGCYSHDTNCHRSSYRSIMNGMYQTDNEVYSWRSDREINETKQFDPVALEAFELRSLREQGSQSISVSLTETGMLAESSFILDETKYELRWYVDGEEVVESRNEPSINVTKSSARHQGVAFRIFDIRDEPIIKSTDEIENFRDVYNGVFGPFGNWYCNVGEGLWEEVEERVCRSTLQARWQNGTFYNNMINYSSNQDLRDNTGWRYWYERSALGSQFVINWDYY